MNPMWPIENCPVKPLIRLSETARMMLIPAIFQIDLVKRYAKPEEAFVAHYQIQGVEHGENNQRNQDSFYEGKHADANSV